MNVLELMNTRRSGGSLPGRRDDGFKLGLVIEGGGLRGVVSAGMVLGLERFGYRDSFDSVYGASAGAINGAFFIAGQAAYGTTIYYENINNDRFIDVKRALIGRPMMSLDYLLDTVMASQKPLAYEAVMGSAIELNVVASSLAEHCSVSMNRFDSTKAMNRAFKASACIPFVGGPPVEIDGSLYLDASVYESIPIWTALDDGCTHVLCLLTRPEGELKGKPGLFERIVVAKFLDGIEPGLSETIYSRASAYKKTVEYVTDPSIDKGSVSIHAVRPPRGTSEVGRTEKGRAALVGGARYGLQALMDTIGEQGHILETISVY